MRLSRNVKVGRLRHPEKKTKKDYEIKIRTVIFTLKKVSNNRK